MPLQPGESEGDRLACGDSNEEGNTFMVKEILQGYEGPS